MTVEQMSEVMSYAELVEWQAYDVICAEEQRKADRQAQKGMRPR